MSELDSAEITLEMVQNVQNHAREGSLLLQGRACSSSVAEHLMLAKSCSKNVSRLRQNKAQLCVKWAKTLTEMGMIFNQLKNTKDAYECYQLAINALVSTSGDKYILNYKLYTNAIQQAVKLLLERLDYSQAMAVVTNAQLCASRSNCESNKMKLTLSELLYDIGVSQLEQSIESESGKSNLEKAYRTLNEINNKKEFGFRYDYIKLKVTNALGGTLRLMGDNKQSLKYFDEAFHLSKKVHWSTADALKFFKNYLEAIISLDLEMKENTVFNEMMKIFKRPKKKQGLCKQIANVLMYLGKVAMSKNRHTKAAIYYGTAVHVWETSIRTVEGAFDKTSFDNTLTCLHIVTQCRTFLCEHHKTVADLKHMLRLMDEFYTGGDKDVEKTNTIARLGIAYQNNHQFEKALVYFKKALVHKTSLAPKLAGDIKVTIGQIYHVLGADKLSTGQTGDADGYFALADNAFQIAMSEEHTPRKKAYLMFCYGHYLLRRDNCCHADSVLHEGYLASTSKDIWLSFHSRDISILDINFREEINHATNNILYLPAALVCLYDRILALLSLKRQDTAPDTARTLVSDMKIQVESIARLTPDRKWPFGLGRNDILGACFELLGYSNRSINKHIEALKAFDKAAKFLPNNTIARKNCEIEYDLIGQHTYV